MTSRMQGMDTEEARCQARGMDGQAEAVGGMFGVLSSRIAGLPWQGTDFDAFKGDVETFTPEVQGACRSLEDNAVALRRAADRQDAVSA